MSRLAPILSAFAMVLIMAVSALALPPPWAIEDVTGKIAPEFSLPDMQGNTKTTADFSGQVVLVNFWATWCGPCRAEMPILEKIQQKFKGRRFSVVAISVDAQISQLQVFLKHLSLSFPVLHDPKSTVADAYGVFAYPTSFLIDRKGVVRYFWIGEQDWLGRPFKDKLEVLLQEK